MAQTDKVKITVEVDVNASSEKAWNTWTSAEHVVQWNTPSPEWHTTRSENNLTVGGRFVSRMEAKDGSAGFDFGGIYDVIEIHKVIRSHLDDDRTIEVVFTPVTDAVTRVTETFEAENVHPVEFQKQGWQAILDNYKAYTESL